MNVFALFSDAFQLELLTPPWLVFRMLTPAPVEMRVGQLVDYELRLHGIPIRWRTEITDWKPPMRFEDSQIRGPYHCWVHEHRFEEYAGGTRVTDRVRYVVPGGPLVHALFVRRDLQRIFEYRQNQLPELLKVNRTDCEAGDITIRRLA